MTRNRKNWGWFSALGIASAIASCFDCALAQITPDGTLPNNSIVTSQGNTTVISGGTQAGSNLFHSFEEFSVPTGGAAYFNNALDIQNIISRVTGGLVSNIDGLLRANGTANLFLLNSNGIIFGPNASLNIGGSFLASTASSLKFADGTEFSAKTSQTTPLLTISVPIGLQFGESAGSIQNQSLATDSSGEIVGLQVQPGKTLAVVGGDVALEGGYLTASDGRLEIGSVTANSLVSLTPTNTGYTLGYQSVESFQDIRLTQGAYANTNGNSGGSIQVQGANVMLTDGSTMAANTWGTGTGEGLTVNATESVQVIGNSADGQFPSGVFVRPISTATGKGGHLTITTKQLLVRDGAQVGTSTSGSGDGGNLIVNASESVRVIGESADGQLSSLSAQAKGAGTAGDLTIATGNLIVRGGALVSASTSGEGQGGNLTVNATQGVELTGSSADGRSPSGLFADTLGVKAAGNLRLETGQLIVRDGAQVSASTYGEGQGGNLTVNASESVELIGESPGRVNSGLYAQAEDVGTAGDLTIATGNLIVRGGALISASTSGEGQGGNLTVNATQAVELTGRSADLRVPSGLFADTLGAKAAGNLRLETGQLIVRDGAQVSASTYGEGQGGNLTVNASQAVKLSGRRSRLFAQTQGTGAAGNLQISTGQLIVRDGAQVSVSSFAQGSGGSLSVNASNSVELIGKSPDQARVPSGLFAQAESTGDAGNMTIATRKLIVRNGAQVSTTNNSAKQGGSLSVNASDSVELIGRSSGLSTQAQGDGSAGDMTIATRKLIVRDGAQVLATTYGQGQGGILSVNASESVELIGRMSGLFADTQGDGAAGNITIATRKLIMRDEAQVFAGTIGKGQGGNLTVDAEESLEISSSTDTDTQVFTGLFTLTQGDGAAGDLTINTGQLTIQGRSQVSVASEGTGKAGNLNVAARSLVVDNQGGINAQTDSGNGGNITLRDLDLLLMRRGGAISSTAGTVQAGGDGGNIRILAKDGFIVAVPQENSDITANAFEGKGGFIDITAYGVFGLERRAKLTPLSDITAFSEKNPQLNGIIEINTPDIDPNSGLVNLPAVPVDTEVAQGCTAGGTVAKSEFIITGRGGLPPNPGDALSTDAVQVNLITLKPEVAQPSTTAVSTSPTSSKPAPIVEAQGWVIDANGKVILTSVSPTVTPHSSWQRTADCQKR